MWAKARAVGLADLQSFLERGLDTFRAMRETQRFLETIAARERTLAMRLFETDPVAQESAAADPTDP